VLKACLITYRGSYCQLGLLLVVQKLGIAEKRGGARGPENVWGSAATVGSSITFLLLLQSHF
jgi:uncharacterized membrane protein